MRQSSAQGPPVPPPPSSAGLLALGEPPAKGGAERASRAGERRVVLAGMAGASAFLAAAIVTWGSGIGGPGRWAPLHLALAGGASLAIGALLPHFTVSLAVARPAPARWRALALVLLAAGALIAIVAVSSGAAAVGAVGAALYLAGIAMTAATAFGPARAGLGRRRGVVDLAYALALAEVGISVTVALLYLAGVGPIVDGWARLKPAHAWLNIIGFVGLVVAATLIHLYPTVVGSRIRPRRSMLVMVVALAGGAAIVAAGYALASDLVARAGAVLAAGGATAAVPVAVGAGRARGRWTTDLDWHRLTIGHLTAAIAWLVVGIGVAAAGVLVGGAAPAGWSVDRLVGPFVIGCVVQVLIGSWSHLLPAVGPGDLQRHAQQRRVLGRWPLVRLASLNVGALLISVGILAGAGALVTAGAVLVLAAVGLALALLAQTLLRR